MHASVQRSVPACRESEGWSGGKQGRLAGWACQFSLLASIVPYVFCLPPILGSPLGTSLWCACHTQVEPLVHFDQVRRCCENAVTTDSPSPEEHGRSLSTLEGLHILVCPCPQDAIVVGIARDEPSERAGSLQSLCWGARVTHHPTLSRRLLCEPSTPLSSDCGGAVMPLQQSWTSRSQEALSWRKAARLLLGAPLATLCLMARDLANGRVPLDDPHTAGNAMLWF